MMDDFLLNSYCYSLRHLEEMISAAVEIRLQTQLQIADLADLGIYEARDPRKLREDWEQTVQNFAALYRAANSISPSEAVSPDAQDWAIYINPLGLEPRPFCPPKFQIGQRVRLRTCPVAVDIRGVAWSGHFWLYPYNLRCWLGHRKPSQWEAIKKKESEGFPGDYFQLLLPSEEEVARRRSQIKG